MHQACQDLCFGEELLSVLLVQRRVQHLKGSKAFEIAMLPQIHFCLPSVSKKSHEGIVAKLVPDTIGHSAVSFPCPEKIKADGRPDLVVWNHPTVFER